MEIKIICALLVGWSLSLNPLLGQESPVSQEDPVSQVESGESGNSEEAPSTTSESAISEQEEVAANPIPDNSDVAETQREESYSDDPLDKQVATALFEQGYFSGEGQNSKEEFIKALKNFQTLNGMEPTGEITPEVIGKLGLGQDQYSPE